MMVLAHGTSFSVVHVRRFPNTVLQSRNSEGYFSQPISCSAFNPESCPDFLKISNPESQIWELLDPENLLEAFYQALQGLEFVGEIRTMKRSRKFR